MKKNDWEGGVIQRYRADSHPPIIAVAMLTNIQPFVRPV